LIHWLLSICKNEKKEDKKNDSGRSQCRISDLDDALEVATDQMAALEHCQRDDGVHVTTKSSYQRSGVWISHFDRIIVAAASQSSAVYQSQLDI
jgi:hypothetical protein